MVRVVMRECVLVPLRRRQCASASSPMDVSSIHEVYVMWRIYRMTFGGVNAQRQTQKGAHVESATVKVKI